MCPFCYTEVPKAVAQLIKKDNQPKCAFGKQFQSKTDIFDIFDLNAKVREQAQLDQAQQFQGCQCYQKSRPKGQRNYGKTELNPEQMFTSTVDVSAKCPRGILEVIVYIHIPPKCDGIEEDDDECKGCILSLEPSKSYYTVILCEKGLGFGGIGGGGQPSSPDFSQVQYCVEMMEETPTVQ